jgi:hypothetical protein
MAFATGVLFSTLTAQERERFTDFRDRVYSLEELERALFPDAAPQWRMRGLEPQPLRQPPPTKVAVALNVFMVKANHALRMTQTRADRLTGASKWSANRGSYGTPNWRQQPSCGM